MKLAESLAVAPPVRPGIWSVEYHGRGAVSMLPPAVICVLRVALRMVDGVARYSRRRLRDRAALLPCARPVDRPAAALASQKLLERQVLAARTLRFG